MTKEQEKEFNEVCGVNPEMDIPTIIRNEREEYMKDKYTPDLEELEGYAEEVSGKAEEAEDKINHQV